MFPPQTPFATFLWHKAADCLFCVYLWLIWTVTRPGDLLQFLVTRRAVSSKVCHIYFSCKAETDSRVWIELIASSLADTSCGSSCFWGLLCLPQGWIEKSPAASWWKCAQGAQGRLDWPLGKMAARLVCAKCATSRVLEMAIAAMGGWKGGKDITHPGRQATSWHLLKKDRGNVIPPSPAWTWLKSKLIQLLKSLEDIAAVYIQVPGRCIPLIPMISTLPQLAGKESQLLCKVATGTLFTWK